MAYGGLYPPYPWKPRNRRLAEDDGSRLVTEDGETLPSATWAETLRSATHHRMGDKRIGLDVRVTDLGKWRYLDDAIRDTKHVTVSAVRQAHNPTIVRLDLRLGRGRATVFSAAAWDNQLDLAAHRAVCDLLRAGTYPTPGALGDATMRRELGKDDTAAKAKLRKLPDPCLRDVEAAMIGLRTETPAEPGTYLPEAVELDRSSCYVTEALAPVPVGHVRRFEDEKYLEEGEWCIALCVVTVIRTLKVGPFPMRASDGELSWPSARGVYSDVWLTKGEVEDSRAAGCLVQILHGWAWERTEPILRGWAESILRARAIAPPGVAACIKRTGNAAIGRLAMTGSPLRVMPDDGESQPVSSDGAITAYVAVPQPSKRLVGLPHIALFLWSEARRHLYHRQLAEMRAGNRVLLTNTDSLILARPTTLQKDGWKETKLTNLVIVAERSYWCDQKTRLPGRSGGTREEAIEHAQAIVYERGRLRRENPMEYWERYIRPWKANGGSQLASLSARTWPKGGGKEDHLADLVAAGIVVTLVDSASERS